MSVKKEKYSQAAVQWLKDYLICQQQDGNPRPFEIFIDELKVVARTEDINRFDNYEKYIRPETGFVLVKLYYNSSPNNDQYYFYLRDDTDNSGSLNGVEEIVNRRLEEREKEYQIARLNEELEKVQKELNDAVEYAENLETRIEQLQNAPPSKFNLGEFTVSALQAIAKNNPKWLTDSPLGKTLAGLVGGESAKPEPVQDSEAGFKKSEPQPEMNENEKVIFQIVKSLDQVMTEQQLTLTALILQKLSAEPHLVEAVAAQLSVNN